MGLFSNQSAVYSTQSSRKTVLKRSEYISGVTLLTAAYGSSTQCFYIGPFVYLTSIRQLKANIYVNSGAGMNVHCMFTFKNVAVIGWTPLGMEADDREPRPLLTKR